MPKPGSHNPNLPLPHPRAGDPIRASDIRGLSEAIMNIIKAGDGVTITRAGGSVFVNAPIGGNGATTNVLPVSTMVLDTTTGTYSPAGTSSGGSGSGGTSLFRVELTTVEATGNTIFGKIITVDASGIDVTLSQAVEIAKPYHLRTLPFDGETILYNDGTSISYTQVTERERLAGAVTHVVNPDYAIGEEILVAKMATGLLSVNYIDISSNHRMWAK